MNIGIIGGGSIGLLVGSYLSKNHVVTLYVKRKEQKEALQAKELVLYKFSNSFRSTPIKVKLISEIDQNDCFFICVKQNHLYEIAPFYTKLDDQTPLIFLQNGMGHVEKLQSLSQPTYVGIVNHGANRMNDYTVNHLGEGTITLASVTGSEEQLAMLIDQLYDSSFVFKKVDDFIPLMHEKLIINAVINPLTAIFDVPNGSVIQNESLRLLARNLCEEAANILRIHTELAWEKIYRVASSTAENTSSMRADILNGKKTENEAISGYILHLAETGQAPYTTFVYHSILVLERKTDV